MTTATETEWKDAAGEISSAPAVKTYPWLIKTYNRSGKNVRTKGKPRLEYLYNRTVITRRQCRCYGCGVAHPGGARMLSVLAVKTIDHKIDYVTLYFCRICREIGRDLTDQEWHTLQAGQLRHSHKEEWLKLHQEYNPSEEV